MNFSHSFRGAFHDLSGGASRILSRGAFHVPSRGTFRVFAGLGGLFFDLGFETGAYDQSKSIKDTK